MIMCLYTCLDPSQFKAFLVLMSFQGPQLVLACCQPDQCLDPSQFMAFLVLLCPSRSPSSCWLAVNLISSVVLVPDNYLARADNIWSGTR